MASLEKPLEGAAALMLDRGTEHGPVNQGNVAVGQDWGKSKVPALDVIPEGFSDHLVVEGARKVDLALEILTAVSLRDPDCAADDAVADIEELRLSFEADGKMGGGDKLLDAGCLGKPVDKHRTHAVNCASACHDRNRGTQMLEGVADDLDGGWLCPSCDLELDGAVPFPWLKEGDEAALFALPVELTERAEVHVKSIDIVGMNVNGGLYAVNDAVSVGVDIRSDTEDLIVGSDSDAIVGSVGREGGEENFDLGQSLSLG